MTAPTEPAPQQAAPAATPPATPTAPAAAPPWGSEEQFDAQRAWQLLQNTRADLDKAKAAPRLTDEQQQKLSEYDRIVESGKSEQQRLEEQAAANARRAETAEAEALRVRVALMHGISADDLDLLGSGSEEQITARAQRIAALHAAQQATAPTPPPAPNTPVLQPGATPSPPPGNDVASRHAQFFPHRAPAQ